MNDALIIFPLTVIVQVTDIYISCNLLSRLDIRFG